MAGISLAPIRDESSRPGTDLLAVVDRLLGCVLLVVALPLMLAMAATVWMLSGRAPLVAHKRVGLSGRPLWVFKIRTMWECSPATIWNARSWTKLVEYVAAAPAGPKLSDDPRVKSTFARWCRRFSIDELPQLAQVAAGTMSLVGPRPITAVEFDNYYGPWRAEVLSVRPGITGLWQIGGRSRLSYEERVRLDLILVRNRSAFLYFRVLAATIPAVLTGAGAW